MISEERNANKNKDNAFRDRDDFFVDFMNNFRSMFADERLCINMEGNSNKEYDHDSRKANTMAEEVREPRESHQNSDFDSEGVPLSFGYFPQNH